MKPVWSFSRWPRSARRPQSHRPYLETLETRNLLSVCTVDRLTDNNPAGGGEGGNGTGDLRYCISHAADGDTITFNAGVTGTINLAGALPDLTHSISIAGPGADLMTVRRGAGGDYRIFTVATGVTAAISGLTIANGDGSMCGGGVLNSGALAISNSVLSGNTVTAAQQSAFGGAVCNRSGTLTLSNSSISGNTAEQGGGGIENAGAMTITQCIISENSALPWGFGGGIANAAVGGTLTVNDSIFSDNHSSEGGAILNGGRLTVSDSTFSGNSVSQNGSNGGGISNIGVMTVSGSTITGNSASYLGGGIYNDIRVVTALVSNSTISDNAAGQDGSAGMGGGIFNMGMLTVNDTSISGNRAVPGYVCSGGGIADFGTLAVNRANISGNSAGPFLGSGFGGGVCIGYGMAAVSDTTIVGNSTSGQGGGIYLGYGMAAVTDSTIVGNGTTVQGSFNGGGIYIGPGTTFSAENTIIARNVAVVGPDVSGGISSRGYNLISDPTDSTGWVDTDVLSVDPRLGPLQDNGGLTQTMAPLRGSPALNAGAPDQLGVPDQRGVVRSGGVNIGAYQASATAFVLTAPPKVTAGTPFDVTVAVVDPFGQVAAGYTGTVTFSTTDPDPGVVLPEDYSFTLADGGGHAFAGETTLQTHGHQTITATDTANGSIQGSVTVKVRHAIHVPPFLVLGGVFPSRWADYLDAPEQPGQDD